MRTIFSSGSPWEAKLGYSRAVQVDGTLYISATAASGPEGIVGDDVFTQTEYILAKLGGVLEEAGFAYADVVQSKLYLTDISQWEEAGRAHGAVFGEIRPALSLVHVNPFLDPAMLVEIELVAHRGAANDA
jgi:enamine deaminase RidA (YjgF/YER057c/UK114 family)